MTPNGSFRLSKINSLTALTLDIALVRRHVLGIANLDSPYKVLAADVNGSSSVTTLYIALIRRVILAIADDFPGGLWAFVPSDSVFEDPLNPWPFETTRSYSAIDRDLTGQDFIGIRLGDVNGSWTAPVGTASLASVGFGGRQTRVRSMSEVVGFSVGGVDEAGSGAVTKSLRSGVPRRVSIPVVVSNFENVTSAQFTLEWDPATMEYAGVDGNGVRGLDPGNFGTRYVGDGKLTFSWDDPEGSGLSLEDATALFVVTMNVKGAGESGLRFADQPTLREVSVGGRLAGMTTVDGRSGGIPDSGTGVLGAGFVEGRLLLRLRTESGVSYTIEWSEAIAGSDWNIMREMDGDGEEQIVEAPVSNGSTRFYRVREE